MTSRKDAIRLLGAFKVIVLVLFKNALWVAAVGGMLPHSPAGMRVQCTHTCTHTQQHLPSPGWASRQ